MVSTTLVFLALQQSPSPANGIPSSKVKAVMDTTEATQMLTTKPVDFSIVNIETFNTLAPKSTFSATEPTKLPYLPQTDSRNTYIQALKKVSTNRELVGTESRQKYPYSSQLVFDASNANLQSSESWMTQYAHISNKLTSNLETSESINALTINPLQPKLPSTENISAPVPLPKFTEAVSTPAPKSINAVGLPAPKSLVIETKPVKRLSQTSRSGQNSRTSYIKALESIMSSSRSVLLALVDLPYATMAVNFFLTSIKPHSIENYMILTMNSETCKFIKTYGVKNCFQYCNFSSAGASKYGTNEFNDKMNVRTDMILEALSANLTVLHSDTDVKFFQNHFKTVPRVCPISAC